MIAYEKDGYIKANSKINLKLINMFLTKIQNNINTKLNASKNEKTNNLTVTTDELMEKQRKLSNIFN